jgi:maltooligosyltrehalose trehalohydrolase
MSQSFERTCPIGAQAAPGGTHFRVWAPGHRGVAVLLENGSAPVPMEREGDGYWSCFARNARPGDRYRLQIDNCDSYPDPASRFQPEGPHGPSQIVDPGTYRWSAEEAAWGGCRLEGQVLYELHIGTFTAEGTYTAAERELGRLAALGITVLELMPVAQFAGRWGWGYDGVDLFAPHNSYGTPDDLRHFIDAAHRAGLGVIQDVVYNHLGPDGNYLKSFSPDYFAKEATEWGDSINFDGENCEGAREFFRENAAYWVREFHFDGLRLDATQSIKDNGRLGPHILEEIGEAVRAAAGARDVIIVAENEPQDTTLIRPIKAGGYGLDGMWNDDLHHSMMVRLTHKREAYYSDYLGRAQEFVSAAKRGFLYQGQPYGWQKGHARGSSSRGIAPQHFITFIENHDQVANTDTGARVRARSHPGVYRAMTAYWLLTPGTPMFFQGQEYGALTQFLYFCDHNPQLAQAVRTGRREFLEQFPSLASEDAQRVLPDSAAEDTFRRCKLDPGDSNKANPQILALHEDLLRLRRTDPVLCRQRDAVLDGAVLSEDCFVLRFFAENGDDRLLVVNFGRDLELPHAPEPLLAPSSGSSWGLAWSSDHHRYGGGGVVCPVTETGWRIPGASTVLLTPMEPTGHAGAR